MTRLKFLFSILVLLVSFAAGACAQTTTVSAGGMTFALTDSINSAFVNQGITSYVGYYNQTSSGFPGFATTGDLSVADATGEIDCSGYMRFVSGSMTLDLRRISYIYDGTHPIYLTAVIYENGVSQGRQLILTSTNANQLVPVPLTAGPIQSRKGNKYVFPQSFITTFTAFFQAPQLASAMAAGANGGAAAVTTFSLNLVPDSSATVQKMPVQ